jgi:hypothetical protein
MNQTGQESREQKQLQWAEQLQRSVSEILAEHPDADPDNVRHTLILLDQPPIERLRRSLTRGRSSAQRT